MENKYVTDNSGGGFGWGGGGGAGIALLLLFLLILFAVFSRGGLGGHDGGYGGHGGHGDGYGHNGIANAELWAQNIQRKPETLLQQIKDTGMLKEVITTGDWNLSKQISDSAHDQRICQLQESLANKAEKITALEMLLMKNDIEKTIGASSALTNHRLDGIECKMLEKPRVEALAGIHPAGIVNFPQPVPYPPYPPYPPYYPDRDRDYDRDRGRCCNPCGGFTI